VIIGMSLPETTPRRTVTGFTAADADAVAGAAVAEGVTCCVEPGGSNADKHAQQRIQSILSRTDH